ncbi:MAG: hypothetical protein OXC91_10255 [Rhodobacteraceae bacterium]|nr:hypothetical protein [Paracoccaceae bacterium]
MPEPEELADDQGIAGVQLFHDRSDPSGGRLLDEGDPIEIFAVGQGQDVGRDLVRIPRVPGDPEITNGLGWVGGVIGQNAKKGCDARQVFRSGLFNGFRLSIAC